MHIRPMKQYVYHGTTLVAMALIMPWVTTVSAINSIGSRQGNNLKTIVKDSLWGLGNGLVTVYDLVTDMSYLDHGDGIDL